MTLCYSLSFLPDACMMEVIAVWTRTRSERTTAKIALAGKPVLQLISDLHGNPNQFISLSCSSFRQGPSDAKGKAPGGSFEL